MTDSAGRTLVVTYCSRDKECAVGLLPALDRYVSTRIHAAATAAAGQGLEFHILSGLHGLLAPDHPIPHYDHLLTAELVAEHTNKVAEQLETLKPDRVVFISRTLDDDPGCRPYREVMRLACLRVRMGYALREIASGAVGVSDLSGLA